MQNLKLKRTSFLRAAATAAGASMLPGRGGAQTPPALAALRLGATTSDDMTPIVYGQRAGIFAKHGLEIILNPMTSGAASAAGLLAGTFDLGKSSIPNLLDAHEKGLPLTLVAAASINNLRALFAAFLLRKDSPIQAGRDFDNQLVSVAALGDIGFLALQVWVDQHGGDAKSIKFVEIPFSASAAAVDGKRVAAAEITYPALAVALETGRMRVIRAHDVLGDGYLQTAWATTVDFSTKHPQLIRAFARAYAEAAAYTNTHHAETAAMMAEYTGIALALISKMPRATAGTAFSAAQIQPIIDASVKYGLLKSRFPADEIIDPNIR